VDEKSLGNADAEIPFVGRVGAGEEMLGREKSGIPVVGEEIEGVFGELVGWSEVVFDDQRTSGLDRPGGGEEDAGDVGGEGGRDRVAVECDAEVLEAEGGVGREVGVEGVERGAADVFQAIGGAEVEGLRRGGEEADFKFLSFDLVAGGDGGVASSEGE
jgi:hypothetical protein